MGYFAALYRKVTVQVKEDIQADCFEDNERMERLDVIFANRYLAAFDAYQAGDPVTKSWQIAFETALRWRPIVLQHLLVGMNAHINLDLGIAAATVAPGAALASLENDFNRINTVLADLVGDVKRELSQIWPALALINLVAGDAEDAIINFSMEKARDEAWRFAQTLAPLNEAEQVSIIGRRDQEISLLGELIAYPPLITSSILFVVRLGERGSVPEIIDILT